MSGGDPPYLRKHGRTGWKYDRTKPADVREAIGGKSKHWIKTFGVLGYQEAVAAARALAVEHDKVIAALRQLSLNERADIAAAGGIDAVCEDATATEYLLSRLETTAPKLARVPLNVGEAHGVTPNEMAGAIVRYSHYLEATRGAAKKKRTLVAKLKPPAAGNFINTLLPLWQNHAPRPIHYVQRFTLHAQRFVAVVGDVAPQAITPQHVTAYRDWLERQAYKRGTAAKHLEVGSSRVDLQACKLEYSIVSPK